ncbi:MAG: hypothetical protein I8H91_12915 [Burkholderiales bacterium]|nr:hypothetical protein [Burkholderiales bacterium]
MDPDSQRNAPKKLAYVALRLQRSQVRERKTTLTASAKLLSELQDWNQETVKRKKAASGFPEAAFDSILIKTGIKPALN